MTDLTKIEKPFGLLDKETQEALRAHGGPYDYFVNNITCGTTHWHTITYQPSFNHQFTYRVAPQPFDWAPVWALLKKEYRWLAMDSSGNWLVCYDKPIKGNGWWEACTRNRRYLTTLNLPTDIPWEDSLMERPQ